MRERETSLQPPAHAGSSFAHFSALKMEAILSSETSVYTRFIQHHIPEDGILHSQRCENLKSYKKKLYFMKLSLRHVLILFCVFTLSPQHVLTYYKRIVKWFGTVCYSVVLFHVSRYFVKDSSGRYYGHCNYLLKTTLFSKSFILGHTGV
jgi:hypothetical protein